MAGARKRRHRRHDVGLHRRLPARPCGPAKGIRRPRTTISSTASRKEFPDVELRRGLRFVDSGRIATAGGLTSGIDLALHIVSRYFGVETASATATYMEYTSDAWRA